MKGNKNRNMNLRGRIWYSDFVDPSGRQIRKSLKTSDARLANIMVSRMMTEAYEKGYFDMKKTAKIKFKELAKEVLEYSQPRKKSYIKVYVPTMKHLVEFFGEKYLREIDLKLINKYQESRKGQVKDITINKEVGMLRICFNHARKLEYIRSNPVVNVEFFKIPERKFRYLELEEIAALLANSKGYIRDIINMALLTGARKSEILKLTWEKIDFHNKLVIFDLTKNNKVREVPMSANLEEMLFNRRSANPDVEYVFTGRNGKPFGAIDKSFWSALKKAGIRNCRFHDLRHTFASQLVMSGANLITVKELLGHSELKTTMIYTHLTPKHNRDAISILENRLDKVISLPHADNKKVV